MTQRRLRSTLTAAVLVTAACMSAVTLSGCSSRAAQEASGVPSPVVGHSRGPSSRPLTTPVTERELSTASVPSSATRLKSQPSTAWPTVPVRLWCTPEADAVGYWSVAVMTPDRVTLWLEQHPSPGLKVTSTDSGITSGGNGQGSASLVVDQTAPGSFSAILFTVTIGDGDGTSATIRADATAPAGNAQCPSPTPGVMYGTGG